MNSSPGVFSFTGSREGISVPSNHRSFRCALATMEDRPSSTMDEETRKIEVHNQVEKLKWVGSRVEKRVLEVVKVKVWAFIEHQPWTTGPPNNKLSVTRLLELYRVPEYTLNIVFCFPLYCALFKKFHNKKALWTQVYLDVTVTTWVFPCAPDVVVKLFRRRMRCLSASSAAWVTRSCPLEPPDRTRRLTPWNKTGILWICVACMRHFVHFRVIPASGTERGDPVRTPSSAHRGRKTLCGAGGSRRGTKRSGETQKGEQGNLRRLQGHHVALDTCTKDKNIHWHLVCLSRPPWKKQKFVLQRSGKLRKILNKNCTNVWMTKG